MIFIIRYIIFILICLSLFCCSSTYNYSELKKTKSLIVRQEQYCFTPEDNAIKLNIYENDKKVRDSILVNIKGLPSIKYNELRELDQQDVDTQNFEINNDSTYILLTIRLNTRTRYLFVVDLQNQLVMNIMRFESVDNYVVVRNYTSSLSGFRNLRLFNHYDAQSPVKWIDRHAFLLATTNGIFKFHIEDLAHPTKIYRDFFQSNFVVFNNFVIVQTDTNIMKINLANGEPQALFEGEKTFLLKLIGHKLYFSQRDKLFKYDLLTDEISLFLKTNGVIKDFWLLGEKCLITKRGITGSTAKVNKFEFHNLETRKSTVIDNQAINIKSAYLSSDQKYFAIKKEIIALGNPMHYIVYDIDEDKVYKIDYYSLHDSS